MSPERAGRFSGRGNRGVGEQRGQASLSVPSRKVPGMSGQRFRRTPGGVCSLGLHLADAPAEFPHLRNFGKVLWSPAYFAASVGYVSDTTVRRYIEHQWDAVLAS